MPQNPAGSTAEVNASASVLIDAIRAASAATALPDITDIVKRAARTATGADGVTFVLREGDQCYYVDEDAIGPLWKGKRFPMTACVSGWAMHHRQAVAIPDIAVDSRIPQDAYRSTFVKSMAMVPIRSAAPIGAIGAYWAHVGGVPPETLHWLQTLADATSAAIEAVTARAEVALLQDSLACDANEMVRMCAWTRRLFFEGEWHSIEAYLRMRFGVKVSHGLSEEALDSLAHELAEEYAPERRWITG